jgi:hypothetical protein
MGYVSPREMLGKLSLRELGLWAAQWTNDPWGEERADKRSAITSYVVAEVNRNPKKKSTPFRPEDFMPYDTEDRKEKPITAKVRSLMQRFKKG